MLLIVFHYFPLQTEGYGRNLFDVYNKLNSLSPLSSVNLEESHLPLTLGRDFAGVVQAVGGNI